MSTPIAALKRMQLTCDAEPGACVAVFRHSLLSLERGDELLQRVGRKVLRGNNDPGRLDDESERREVSERFNTNVPSNKKVLRMGCPPHFQQHCRDLPRFAVFVAGV